MVGAFVPSVPVDHQHVAHAGGRRAPSSRAEVPCFRDTDNLVYGKDEAGGMLIGGYEPNPAARWIDGVPWDHGASPVQSDMDRFAPLLEGAIRRFPFLEHAGVIRLLCHPDAMTPDGNPLLGPMPGDPGLLGRRRAFAERLRRRRRHRARARGVDHRAASRSSTSTAYRAWRFGARVPRPVVRGARARARPTATTTGCATRSTRTSGGAGCGRARCRFACRSSEPCSGPRTAGSAPIISSRAIAGVAAAPISDGSAGRGRPGSRRSEASTRRSASASGSST